ncbi:MAG: ABC transporter substrate-binding protein [Proteobacteria bacterium]|nr:ABC transporter substrate-binding protein [Pseudomonadota bacterium]
MTRTHLLLKLAIPFMLCFSCPAQLFAQAAPAAAPAAAEIDFSKLPEPMSFAKDIYAQALKLNSAAPSKERNDQIRTLVNSLVNYDDYAERALGDKWNSIDSAKQTEFKALFKELLELTYLKKISDKSFKDNYNIEWDRVIKTKTSATVSCFTKQKDVETELEFVMRAAQGKWEIQDVLIDGSSLAQTYQKKYAKKLDQKGIDGLMKDMRNEIEKLKK